MPLAEPSEVRGPAGMPGHMTPQFGVEPEVLASVREVLGSGQALLDSGLVWPRWPTHVSTETSLEKALVGLEGARARPVDVRHAPVAIEYRADTPRHRHYVVR